MCQRLFLPPGIFIVNYPKQIGVRGCWLPRKLQTGHGPAVQLTECTSVFYTVHSFCNVFFFDTYESSRPVGGGHYFPVYYSLRCCPVR